MFWPEHFKTRSQDLIEAYHDEMGQFYWQTLKNICEKPFFSESAAPVIIPRYLWAGY